MRYGLNKKLYVLKDGESAKPGDSVVEVMTLDMFKKQHHQHMQDYLLVSGLRNVQYSKAELLSQCIIGTFVTPQKEDILNKKAMFGYYMDSKTLIFIDDSHYVQRMLHQIERYQKFEKSDIFHLFFELLEFLIHDEVEFLLGYEDKLSDIEERIESGDGQTKGISSEILNMRKELSKINAYYTQLQDISDTLSENDNNLLDDQSCLLFKLFSDRMERLSDHTQQLREYALQILEMYQARLDIGQNRIMTFLTIVTSIFMPLTLITGWYGMNFKEMPELGWKFGYPVCIIICIALLCAEIYYMHRNKWLRMS